MPIADGELLHRRIPRANNWYLPDTDTKPAADAFKPHPQNDQTGISLSRASSPDHPEFLSARVLAERGRSTAGYYIAVLRASDLRSRGIIMLEDPIPGDGSILPDPGHIVLPQLNSKDRKSPLVEELMQQLADELTVEILGPFFPGSDQS